MEGQSIILLINELIDRAVRDRATDIHIEPQEHNIRVRYRVDGTLHRYQSLPVHILPQMISRIKVMANMDIAERRLPQGGSFQARVGDRPIDVRVSTVPSVYGEKAVLRLLDRSASTYDLDVLGFTDANLAMLNRIISRPQGVFLLTGPTGSGKTTTLYAMLNRLNREDVNIVTIEDPVEYQIAGITQVAVHIRAGVTFASALRHFLRQDPDIMMVGEVRDVETARIVVQAALTGHLVLSTMHTGDAMGAVTRLLEMNIEPYLVAASISGVAAQRLVRVLCPQCKRSDPVSREDILLRFGEDAPAGEFLGPTGCERCSNTGYRGRAAIFEVAELSEELRHLIINNQPAHILRHRAVALGMTPILADGLRKAASGITSLAEIERVVYIERQGGEGLA